MNVEKVLAILFGVVFLVWIGRIYEDLEEENRGKKLVKVFFRAILEIF